MGYTTPAAIRAILDPDFDPNTTDTDTGSAARMSDPQLQVACDEAQATIDAWLLARYPTGFADPPPDLVAQTTRDIAAWLATLTDRRGEPLSPSDPVQLRYNRAVDQLARLADGRINLSVPAPSDASSEAEMANPYNGDVFSPRDAGFVHGSDGSWAAPGSRGPLSGYPGAPIGAWPGGY